MKYKHIFLLCLIAFLNSTHGLEPFSLEEFINSEISIKSFTGIWVDGNKFLHKPEKDYVINEVGKVTQTAFLQGKVLSMNAYTNVNNVYPSGDLLYGLIEYNVQPVYRHSKTAQYALYNNKTKRIDDLVGKQRLQLCTWATNNSLIYVQNNDIYYIEDVAKLTTNIRISKDGQIGQIYNGVSDWVYEEEVLSSDRALWLSQNKTTLVYAQFDDTNVDTFSYVKYGEPSSLKPYPEVLKIKYPKVSRTNPKVKLFLYDLKKKGNPKEVAFLNAASDTFIVSGVVWNVTEFFVFYTNRIQNEGYLMKCDENYCKMFEKYVETEGWLDVSLPVFSKNGSTMAQIKPYKGFQQLWLKSSEKTTLEVVTKENKTVLSIYGVDGQIVYYSATVKNKHWEQHIYSYDHRKKNDSCLSCNYKTIDGKCTYATASFSTNLTHYAQTCQGPYPNYITLENMTSNLAGYTWEINQDARKKLKEKALPQIQDLTISRPGYDIAVRLLLPPNFDKNKKYAMIVNVYAGPNSNQITDRFSIGFEKYVVTNMSYIYAYIDGGGSGLRGNELKHKVYKHLGTVEIEDQIIATKELQTKYSYIDSNRTCIWGWSYGGFATAWALVQDKQNVFKCGVSVAPVTNFQLYDSIYTERYMGSKLSNEAGYKATDLTSQAKQFKGKSFFLIHGNADDNVHYQQSMLLSRALELADVHFQQMSYPEENHGLRGVSPHLYHEIIKFWQDNLINVNNRNGSAVVTISMMVLYLSGLLLAILNV